LLLVVLLLLPKLLLLLQSLIAVGEVAVFVVLVTNVGKGG